MLDSELKEVTANELAEMAHREREQVAEAAYQTLLLKFKSKMYDAAIHGRKYVEIEKNPYEIKLYIKILFTLKSQGYGVTEIEKSVYEAGCYPNRPHYHICWP